MTRLSRFAAAAAFAASLSMAATPVLAAGVQPVQPQASVPAVAAWDSNGANVHDYWHGRHHRDGIDAGDVLAGVLILGGIAAIASAASKPKQDRYERYPAPPPPPQDLRYRDSRSGDAGGNGLNGAVDQCLAEIQRDVRVDSVEGATRDGDGWRVTGTLYNGDPFTCRIGNDGRIDTIDYGRGPVAAADRQWTDEAYRQARARSDTAPGAVQGAQPAYPGGPLPGEEVDGDIGG